MYGLDFHDSTLDVVNVWRGYSYIHVHAMIYYSFSLHVEVWVCFSSESEDEEESVEGSHHGGMAKRHKGEKDRTTVSTYYEKTT